MLHKLSGHKIQKQMEKLFQFKGKEGVMTCDLGLDSGLKKKHHWENCQKFSKRYVDFTG